MAMRVEKMPRPAPEIGMVSVSRHDRQLPSVSLRLEMRTTDRQAAKSRTCLVSCLELKR